MYSGILDCTDTLAHAVKEQFSCPLYCAVLAKQKLDAGTDCQGHQAYQWPQVHWGLDMHNARAPAVLLPHSLSAPAELQAAA